MHELYQVLGVRAGAADQEIKAAFRCLAKQLHPDLHPRDADAERRFRDVIAAYETLLDPPSRAAYDAGLTRQRSLRRWQFRSKAATMLAAFALTVSLGLFWRQLSDALLPAYPPRVPASETVAARKSEAASPLYGVSANVAVESAAANKSTKANAEPPSAPGLTELATGSLLPSKAIEAPPDPANRGPGLQRPDEGTVPPSSPALGKTHSWASYQDTGFGFTLQYPADVFVPEPAGDGKSLLSRDGRARLVISAALNTGGITLAKHRRSLMEGPYRGAAFDYAPKRGAWFVLSGTLGAEMFYQRVTFACDGQAFHTWRLVYPVSERALYDRIVEEVHRRYRHGGGDERRCG